VGFGAEEWVDACPAGVAFLDRELRVVRANPAFVARAGDPGGRHVTDVLPDLCPELEMVLRFALESGRAVNDVELTVHAGRVRASAFPAPFGVGLMLGEPTAPPPADDRESLFHAIFDHAAIGIIALEWRGQGIWVNPAFMRILGGYTREDLARLGVPAITHPDDREIDLAHFHRLIDGEIDHYQLDKRYLRKDGSVMPARLIVSCARDAAGAPQLVIAMIEDVSARKAAEAERERLIGELERALQARDVFLAIASHELKTPLTSLRLGLQTYARRVAAEGQPPAKELDVALRQTVRLSGLVEDLLDVSRVAGGRLVLDVAPLDLAEALRDLVERLRPVAEREGCALTLAAPDELAITGDRARLEQVVGNLIANAIKFGPGRPVELTLESDDAWARLTVRDQGIGISARDQERIFLPFERAVSELDYGGLGLGLYIARHLVEAHGGRIRVESAPGRGSLFTVELARSAAPRPPAGGPSPSASG
jgi:PAS domain S-box-containing protein